MKDNQQILGTEPIGKLLIKYSVPAIIGMIVNGLYNVVDRIFIGNIPGVGPLAITGLGYYAYYDYNNGIWYVNRYRYYNKHIY